MHESLFSYQLTRPYPFKWFTPAVIVGGIIATILFSFINLATNGYVLGAVETLDLNSTITNYTLMWEPLLNKKLIPFCEPHTLQVGTSYYTNNTMLSYRLDSIWEKKGYDNGGPVYAELPYKNQRLYDCTIPKPIVYIEGIGRTSLQISREGYGARVRAAIDCSIDIPEGTRGIQLSASYDLNPDSELWAFPGRDSDTKASLWWGESLLAWHYVQLTTKVQKSEFWNKGDNPLSKGHIQTPVRFTPSKPQDFETSNFFDFSKFSFSAIGDDINFTHKTISSSLIFYDPTLYINRVFYATVMVDLGQQGLNILSDPDLLQFYSKNITSIKHYAMKNSNPYLSKRTSKDLATAPYNTSDNYTLAINPSTISAMYLCQVPIRKSIGSLIVSILIANLVFLQTSYKIFVFSVDYFMVKTDPLTRSCAGCGAETMGDLKEGGFHLVRPIKPGDDDEEEV
ncbi:hypothetical protein P280DRAFT_543395 [Massarina eburnea CBS 473.64]|uniref:Uncharacterized protein n=1 Tax=Massarina eburnea CBS 473.64 TaxID=1395130 RepID=A0A6A6RZY9_9PLEO|nr:hypothetical protein P280DRAFT_543395 [Massarina eburnea CBS 473.64]